MSKRREPFPSSIEGCEELLTDITPFDRATLRMSEIPPRHMSLEFLPQGALLGEYGDRVLRPKDSLIVGSLSDPEDLSDPSRLLYRVMWNWKRRRFGAQILLSEWYCAPRGEGYSSKHIAAMALFRTYHDELNDQEEVRQLWKARQHAVHKLGVRLYNKSQGTELPEHVTPVDHNPFPDYPLRQEVTQREEPTNEELGVLPPQPQYEQPSW